jgi:hypothetical protein
MLFAKDHLFESLGTFLQVLLKSTMMGIFLVVLISLFYDFSSKLEPFANAWAGLVQRSLFINYNFSLCYSPIHTLIIPTTTHCPVIWLQVYKVSHDHHLFIVICDLAETDRTIV